jgi:hypothetical protein
MLVGQPPFDGEYWHACAAKANGLLIYKMLVGWPLLMVSTGTHAQKNGWTNGIAPLPDAR